MTFLPIVERELRIAARRRLTLWTRLLAVILALLVWGALQALAEVTRGMGGFKAGEVQFSVLKWMSFLFACAAGVFFTSDSLSEEKREGTLGLLFLTDLRGHDVVLGKLISHSLQAFYGLLAAFPILALTLLVGGVAGDEFAHAMFVICNTLFFFLSLGLLVSSISRNVMRAMNATFGLSLIFLLGLPLVDSLSLWHSGTFTPFFSLASPGFLFERTGGYRFNEYWLCLGIQHALAWSFLILSSFFTPRAWQEKSTAATRSWWGRLSLGQFGRARATALRQKLLDRDPLYWLAARERWLPRLVWAVTVLAAALLAWESAGYYLNSPPSPQISFFQSLFKLGLMIWVASQATRFFVDAIRNGAMELMMVTPVTPKQIIHGHWTALWRTFLVPALFVIVAQSVGTVIGMLKMKNSMPGPAGVNWLNSMHAFLIVTGIVSIVNFLTNLLAVAWFGMWMGMTTRKNSFAILKTLCFVIVLPWLSIMFLQVFSMFLLAFNRWPFWFGTVIGGLLNVTKDLLLVFWARRNLLSRFRETVSRGGHAPAGLPPPPMFAASLPPVLTTPAANPPGPSAK